MEVMTILSQFVTLIRLFVTWAICACLSFQSKKWCLVGGFFGPGRSLPDLWKSPIFNLENVPRNGGSFKG